MDIKYLNMLNYSSDSNIIIKHQMNSNDNGTPLASRKLTSNDNEKVILFSDKLSFVVVLSLVQ